MLLPAFKFSLSAPVSNNLVTLGKYDGKHTSLTFATSDSIISICTPQLSAGRAGGDDGATRLLNVTDAVTCLVAADVKLGLGRDVLVVGTRTGLWVYDVHDNCDLFYKEIPDGVSSLVVGYFNGFEEPVIITVGDCTVQGYSSTGDEVFWTLTGDVVTCMLLIDLNKDSENELIVASEDFEIRHFASDDCIAEVSETDSVKFLCAIGGAQYGFALADGTIGVYNNRKRIWRLKTKQQISSLTSYGGAKKNLILAYDNGLVEARSKTTGEVLWSDTFSVGVAALSKGDLKGDGKESLVVVLGNGDVRGYLLAETDLGGALLGNEMEGESLRSVNQEKLQLLHDLKNFKGSNQHLASKPSKHLQKSLDGGVDDQEGEENKQRGRIKDAAEYPLTKPLRSSKMQPVPVAASAQEEPQSTIQRTNVIVGNLLQPKRNQIPSMDQPPSPTTPKITPTPPLIQKPPPSQTLKTTSLGSLPTINHTADIDSISQSLDTLTTPPDRPSGRKSARKKAAAPSPLPSAPPSSDSEKAVTCTLEIHYDPKNEHDSGCFLVVAVPEWAGCVRLVNLRAEKVFEDGVFIICPTQPARQIREKIHLCRDGRAKIEVQVVAGLNESGPSWVFEETMEIPEFVMYKYVEGLDKVPESFVEFVVEERAEMIAQWIHHSFLDHPPPQALFPLLHFSFLTLQTAIPLHLTLTPPHLRIHTPSPALAAPLIASLCAYCRISDLEVTANFPNEWAKIGELMKVIKDADSARGVYAARMAEGEEIVRGLVVGAEGARSVDDIIGMKETQSAIYDMNRDLISEHVKRVANHELLVRSLKEVNAVVQVAASLRVGRPKARLIAACREGIRACDGEGLERLVWRGAGV